VPRCWLGGDALSKDVTWEQLIDRVEHRHCVHLYGDDHDALARSASLYLGEGLDRKEGVLVVATPAHRDDIVAYLARSGRAQVLHEIVFVSAASTLERIGTGGELQWHLFESVVTAAMRDAQGDRPFRNVRVFGEMVGLLWAARRFSEVQQLEGFWNRLLASQRFDLYCAYPLDIFSGDFQFGKVDAILSGHSHLLPLSPDNRLEEAVERGMHVVLGSRMEAIRELMSGGLPHAGAALPPGEAAILWLRNNLPEEAEAIIACARAHYEAGARAAKHARHSASESA